MTPTKPSYKTKHIADLDPGYPNEVWSVKIDGAHTILQMEKGKTPLLFGHRLSKKTNEPIPYTQKMTHIENKSPVNAVLRGETYAVDQRGLAVHPDVVTSILNSSTDKSLELQKRLGIKTQTALIDVDSVNGESAKDWSFRKKREFLESVVNKNPDFHLPDTAFTQEQKSSLLSKVLAKTHMQSKEGVIVHDLDKPGAPFTKAKVIDHHDVVIRNIFHEEAVKPGRQPMAGGFEYSWTEDGPIMGRVGTGFNHAMKKDMMENPGKYVGRTAKVKALDLSKNRVLVKPSFDGFHVEKNIKEASMNPFFLGFEKQASEKKKEPFNFTPYIAGASALAALAALKTKYPTHINKPAWTSRLITPIGEAPNRVLTTLHGLNPKRTYTHGTIVDNLESVLENKGLVSARTLNGVPLGAKDLRDIELHTQYSKMAPNKIPEGAANFIHGPFERHNVFLGHHARTPLFYARRAGSEGFGLNVGKELVFEFDKSVEKAPGFMLHTLQGSAGSEHTVLHNLPFDKHLKTVYTSAENKPKVEAMLKQYGYDVPIKSLNTLRARAIGEGIVGGATSTLTSMPVMGTAAILTAKQIKEKMEKRGGVFSLVTNNPKRIDDALEYNTPNINQSIIDSIQRKNMNSAYEKLKQKVDNPNKVTSKVLYDIKDSLGLGAAGILGATLPLLAVKEFLPATIAGLGSAAASYGIYKAFKHRHDELAQQTIERYKKTHSADELNKKIISTIRRTGSDSSWKPSIS